MQKGVNATNFATLGGSAGGIVVALSRGHQALALAEKAQALKQAAIAAAQAGKYQDALALGGQAKATGKSAMKLGKQAQQAAKVAKILTLTSGGLAIVDGGINLYRGTKDSLKVNDLKEVAQNAMKKATENGSSANEAAQKDFESVMKQLEKQEKKAHKQLMVGGIKEACGGTLIASAFMGPAGILPGVGASITYVGASIWEHWDSFSKFASETFTTHTTPEFDEAINKQREKEAISSDWTP